MQAIIEEDMLLDIAYKLPRSQQAPFIMALVEYGITKKEPSNTEPWHLLFIACKPRLDNKKKAISPIKTTRFIKPTIEEISLYVSEKGYSIDAKQFWNYYESKGWKVGNTPMKNWKAAVTTWQRKDGFSTNEKERGWWDEYEIPKNRVYTIDNSSNKE